MALASSTFHRALSLSSLELSRIDVEALSDAGSFEVDLVVMVVGEKSLVSDSCSFFDEVDFAFMPVVGGRSLIISGSGRSCSFSIICCSARHWFPSACVGGGTGCHRLFFVLGVCWFQSTYRMLGNRRQECFLCCFDLNH